MGYKIYFVIIGASFMLSMLIVIGLGTYPFSDVVSVFFITLTSYMFTYALFCYLKKRIDYRKKNFLINRKRIHLDVDYKKLNIFMTLYLIIMIIYGIKTGDGAAERGSLSSSSVFASLWPADAVFSYYYCMERPRHRTFTYINSTLYLIYKLILGWTGGFFLIAFFEMFFLVKDKKYSIVRCFIIVVSLIVIGGMLYSFLYPLKYTIRFGVPFDIGSRLRVTEGIAKLTNRLSHIDTSLFVHNNMQKVIYTYQSQGVALAEFKAAFRPLIPGSIFKNKIFSSVGSCIYNAKTGYYTGINITDNVGILMYYYLLYQCDYYSFLLCFPLLYIVLKTITYMCDLLRKEKDEFDILIFWYVVHGYSICGTLENSFTNGPFKMVFFFPLLIVLGVLKVSSKGKSVEEFAVNGDV